jgi:hypothetical protein
LACGGFGLPKTRDEIRRHRFDVAPQQAHTKRRRARHTRTPRSTHTSPSHPPQFASRYTRRAALFTPTTTAREKNTHSTMATGGAEKPLRFGPMCLCCAPVPWWGCHCHSTPGCRWIGHVGHAARRQLVFATVRPTRVAATSGWCQISYMDHTGCHRLNRVFDGMQINVSEE